MGVAGPLVRVDDGHGVWSIGAPNLAISWRRTEAGEVVLTSVRAGGHEWVSAETSVFTADGPPGPSAHLQDADIQVDGNRLTMTGTLSPSGLTVTSVWTVDDHASVVINELRVRNDTDRDVELGALSTVHLRTCAVADRQLHVLAGGRWHEAMPPRGYRLETRDLDEIRGTTTVGAADDGRSSGEHLPWLALSTPDDGLLIALVWSGRWRLHARRDGDDVALALGIADVARTLAPGEEIPLPGLVMAGYTGDLDNGANAWRAWVTRRWTPPVPDDWPWVQYNHWYAYHGDIDEDRLSAEAEHAAAMGCEVFVIDDGWFRGRRPDSYHEGWGDWHEDPAKFPNGLKAFGDRVRGLGMKFGLWVEPERADPDGVLLRDHPGFVATRDGLPISRLPDGTGGVHLCLGNPEVQEWMAADLIRVVRDYGVDWLKWDYNIGYGLGCNNPDHGHQAGDGHHAHTLGLYRVLEEVRAACPALVIENCASGGHRVDMGILRYTHTNWLSDYTHRAASCRQHAQGAGLMLPVHHLNTWVLHDRDTTEFRSRMGGAFGVSSFMGQWSEAERAALTAAIAEYKRLRPLLAGDRYLLSGPLHQDWDIWQFVAPDRASFAVLAFHDAGRIDAVTMRLRGLDPGQTYRVELGDGDDPVDVTGASLMADGLDLRLVNGESAIVWGVAR